MEPISSADARVQFSDMLAKTFYQNRIYVIQRCNRPMAVLLSIEDYEKMQLNVEKTTKIGKKTKRRKQ